MILSAEQRRRVEENMGLVGKVIKDKVHDKMCIRDRFMGCIRMES